MHHFFFGATLIALNKKDGGVRPITVGCTLQCLAAKCAGNHIMKAIGTLMAPHQLGYGVSVGAVCIPARTHLLAWFSNWYPEGIQEPSELRGRPSKS